MPAWEEEKMNKKIFAIIKREYITRVRTKGFIIGTILFPVVLVLIFGGIFLFSRVFQPSIRSYYVIDRTGHIYEEFVKMLPDTLDTGERKFQFTEKKVEPEYVDTALAEFQELVLSKQIDGYLVIPENVVDSCRVKYSARNVSNFDEQRMLSYALSMIVTNFRLERADLPVDEIRKEMAQGRVKLVSRQVTKEGEIEKSAISSFGLTYLLSYIMLLMIMIYGQTLMRSVIEEKTQRITETIISAVKPLELMIGKIIGICSLGLTQLVFIGLIISAVVAFGEPLFVKFGVKTPEILDVIRQIQFTPTVFAFMVVFFLLGFVFFASLFAAIGAMVNTEDEGQQFQMPLIFLIMIGYFMMLPVIQNPDTSMAFWASLVPFFTPLVMFARVAVMDPVFPKGAVLSLFTMGISVVVMILFTAKIYRVGILMYGKKASIREVIKWVRYK
jgi:ABC-2 type transport system permease protein